MPNDSHSTADDRTAALKRKQFYAKLVTFAMIVAFVLLKPKVEAWLNARNGNDPDAADVTKSETSSSGDVFGNGDVDLGTLTINDANDSADTPTDSTDVAWLETTDPGGTSPKTQNSSKSSPDFQEAAPPKKSTATKNSTPTTASPKTTTATEKITSPGKKTESPAKTSPLPRMAEPPPGISPKAVSKDERNNPQKSGAGSKSSSSPPKETSEDGPGKLTLVRGSRDEFRSFAGLMYVRGSEDGHRLKHVLKHAEDNPEKPVHGVFDGSRDEILAWIDRAYLKGKEGGKGTRVEDQGGRTVYTVDLGEKIGYVGGQVGKRKGHPACRFLRLVVQNGSDVVTAYPAQSL